jgi:hypothetical protein
MKNQYFGDVSDYRKYGLLRALCGAELSLAVCWMLTADEGGRDGNRLKYLEQRSRYRPRDPELFDFLQTTVMRDGVRDVNRIESSGLLGDAVFHSDLLRDDAAQRDEYSQAALRCAVGRDLVFFDPDKGIEVPSTKYGRRKSCMYVYWRELAATRAAGFSLVVYQHKRRVKVPKMVADFRTDISDHTGAKQIITIVTKYVIFLLIPQERHLAALERGLERLRDRWGAEFSIC